MIFHNIEELKIWDFIAAIKHKRKWELHLVRHPISSYNRDEKCQKIAICAIS